VHYWQTQCRTLVALSRQSICPHRRPLLSKSDPPSVQSISEVGQLGKGFVQWAPPSLHFLPKLAMAIWDCCSRRVSKWLWAQHIHCGKGTPGNVWLEAFMRLFWIILKNTEGVFNEIRRVNLGLLDFSFYRWMASSFRLFETKSTNNRTTKIKKSQVWGMIGTPSIWYGQFFFFFYFWP
jgi:hypothetical protein